jgi:hypothetical protein
MKGLLSLLASVVALSVAYYYSISLPAHNRAVLDFEKQKYRDAQLRAEREEAQKRETAERRRDQLDTCLARVEDEYNTAIRENASSRTRTGFQLDARVYQAIQRRQEQNRRDCYRQNADQSDLR